MRYLRAAALITAVIATTAPASAGETIRIETRPYYGAVITREAGVRVFRPIPPTSKMIINPGGKTPLSLNFEEYRSESHTYHHGGVAAHDHGSGADAGYAAIYGGFHHGKHHHHDAHKNRHKLHGRVLPVDAVRKH